MKESMGKKGCPRRGCRGMGGQQAHWPWRGHVDIGRWTLAHVMIWGCGMMMWTSLSQLTGFFHLWFYILHTQNCLGNRSGESMTSSWSWEIPLRRCNTNKVCGKSGSPKGCLQVALQKASLHRKAFDLWMNTSLWGNTYGVRAGKQVWIKKKTKEKWSESFWWRKRMGNPEKWEHYAKGRVGQREVEEPGRSD